MLQLFESAMSKFADRPAVAGRNLRLTYADLSQRAAQWRTLLASHGVHPGDRVVSLLGNSPLYAEVLLGVLRSGAAMVPLSPQEPLVRLVPLLAEVEPALVVVADDESQSRLQQACPVRRIVTATVHRNPGAAECAERPLSSWPSSSPALIQYTSGTTGTPKGVVFSHDAMATALSAATDYLPDFAGLRLVLGIPLCHAYGQTCLLEYLLGGGHVVITNGYLLATQITRSVRDAAGQAMEGPPTLYDTACKDRNFCSSVLPDLVYLGMNSGKPRVALLQDLRQRFPAATIVVRYGITEVAGPLSRLVWRPDAMVPLESCGRPARHIQLWLADDNGVAVRGSQCGEVVVRSDAQMSGYFRSPSPATPADGYHTGDIGRLDADGMLYLIGRKSRMIKSAGHRIFPGEIEDVIMAVPGVAECAVGGVEDAQLGERICAWIVPQQTVGAEALRVAVQASCRQALPSGKCPHEVMFRSSLPKTLNGKVRVSVLAKDAGSCGGHRLSG